jgi:hypothetical protein
VLELAKLGFLAEVEEISTVSGSIANALEGVEGDEGAMKMYSALTTFHKKLKKIVDKRSDVGEEEVKPKLLLED